MPRVASGNLPGNGTEKMPSFSQSLSASAAAKKALHKMPKPAPKKTTPAPPDHLAQLAALLQQMKGSV